MNNQKYPVLANLLGSYFHQDWVDEFSDDDGALAAMQQSEPREQIAEARSELSDILVSDRSDAETDELLHDELGCFFDPTSRGLTSREWLASVGRRLAEFS